MAGESGVMRRKLAVGRADGAQAQSGARAWRVAFARAARGACGLELAAQSLRDDRMSLGELLDQLPDRALFAVIEGPGQGLGLLVLAPEMLASAIEMQTIGKVAAGPPIPRRPTRTDAAMTAGLIDMALEGLETALATSADLCWTAGFRYASFLEDARPLALLLEDVPFRVLTTEYDIATGTRSGKVLLALPAEGKGPKPARLGDPGGTDPEAREWGLAFGASVLGADVALDAVIGRFSISLQGAMALEVGMEFRLPDASLDTVTLLVPGGDMLAQGKLGQHRGMRAVRLRAVGSGSANPAEPAPLSQARPAPAAAPAGIVPPVDDNHAPDMAAQLHMLAQSA